MFRRPALVSAAAAALVLLPTAALAYDAPGYSSVVSDPSPAAGAPFTFAVDGGEKLAGKTVLLTVTSDPASIPNSAIQIAGTATTSKVAAADGSVNFSVTLTQAGTYDAVATVDGAAISTQSLGVTSAPAAASGSAAKGATTHVPGHDLAATGFDGAGLAAGAGALVVAGAGAVLLAKRRQSAQLGA